MTAFATALSSGSSRRCTCSSRCSCANDGCRCRRTCSCGHSYTPPTAFRAASDPAAMWSDVGDDRELNELDLEVRRRAARHAAVAAYRRSRGSAFSNPWRASNALRARLARQRQRQWLSRLRWNRHYASRLGWGRSLPHILRTIRCPRCPIGSPGFIGALARWQARIGLAPTGVLTPETWRAMQSQSADRARAAPAQAGSGGPPPVTSPGADAGPSGFEPDGADSVPEPGFEPTPSLMDQSPDAPPDLGAEGDPEPDAGDAPSEELGVGFRGRRSYWNTLRQRQPVYTPPSPRPLGMSPITATRSAPRTHLTPWATGFRP